MATMTLCNIVFMLMLLAALSTCHGNAFGAWSGEQRQRKKSWLFTDGLGFQTAGSGTRTRELPGIEPRALTTRPRRLSANLHRDATSCLLFLNQSVLADFDDRKKKTTGFKTRSLSGMSNYYDHHQVKNLAIWSGWINGVFRQKTALLTHHCANILNKRNKKPGTHFATDHPAHWCPRP